MLREIQNEEEAYDLFAKLIEETEASNSQDVIEYASPYALEFKSKGACAVDLETTEDVAVPQGGIAIVGTGTRVRIPEGYAGFLLPRSSTFMRYGVMLANTVGLIDNDYCGNGDEIKAMLFRPMSMHNKPEEVIPKGTRLAQLCLVKIGKPEYVAVDALGGEDRGGFGSTGI